MAKKRKQSAHSKCKHQHAPKGNVVWTQSAEEATLANKPYINAYACGYGVQGDTKYNRTKEKRAWKRDLQEGASRGSFLYFAHLSFSELIDKERSRGYRADHTKRALAVVFHERLRIDASKIPRKAKKIRGCYHRKGIERTCQARIRLHGIHRTGSYQSARCPRS